VSQAQRSDRLKGIGILFYVLGLSYGGVEDALAALGWAGSKSSIYRDVQTAGEAVQRIRLAQGQRKVQVLGADTTFVLCNREQVTIAVGVDALSGEVLEIDLVDVESAEAIKPFIEELAQRFEVEVLLTDDQDSYKVVADNVALKHSICRAHVNRNVAHLVGQLGERALNHPEPVPEGLNLSLAQFLDDLEYFQLLVALRPTDGAQQLWQLYRRYRAAPPPRPGERASMWYRFRLAVQRWADNWPRLTLDQQWQGHRGEHLDGTNNATERAIGWLIKERYRTMRTYKRRQSIVNVASLIGHLGSHSGGATLGDVLAA
jgi:transposase-like protein